MRTPLSSEQEELDEQTILNMNDRKINNNNNVFNPSSSSSSNSILIKPNNNHHHHHHYPQQQQPQQQHSTLKSNSNELNNKKKNKKIQPVAKAYEGSESDELLESLIKFEKEYESVAVKLVNNNKYDEINKRHSTSSKPPITMPSSFNNNNNNKRFSNYETTSSSSSNHYRQSSKFKNEIKSNEYNRYSSEISSSMIDLNRKQKSTTNKS
jgi:hypothetical protein